MGYLNVNGQILPAGTAVLQADNRSYRYGDGLFETMKVVHGRISLAHYHWERFFSGLQLLGFAVPASFTPTTLQEEIIQLCTQNKCTELARIRLSAFRGNGGLYDDDTASLQYMIECQDAGDTVNRLNEEGLVTGIFPDARKSCDRFARLKSANYLPYAMAARYARRNGLHECLVLNTYERIADATIANVFLVRDGCIYTPPVSEGCIAGTMRRYLLEKGRPAGFAIEEKAITPAETAIADELFLTNALYGLRWVKNHGAATYGNQLATAVYNELIKPIWS
ncbi:MAG: aminotransferase class IV [Chitinophagaceae bacterium]